MNCAECERLFDAYLDGQLTGSLRLELDAHRLRCRRCQQTLAMMEAFEHVVMTDRRAPALSDDFTRRVMGRIQKQQPLVKRLFGTRTALAVGAVLQAAAVVFLAVWLPNGQPARNSSGTAIADDPNLDAKQALRDYIEGRMKVLSSAKENLSADLSQLSRLATNLNVSDQTAKLVTADPLTGFLRALMPTPEENEPKPLAPDQHSL